MYPADSTRHPWLEALNEEDLAFLKRFLLASGSLKEVAKGYGVSYPTVRLRLDRLIQKATVADELKTESSFERNLRILLADGAIDAATFKSIWSAHQSEINPEPGT